MPTVNLDGVLGVDDATTILGYSSGTVSSLPVGGDADAYDYYAIYMADGSWKWLVIPKASDGTDGADGEAGATIDHIERIALFGDVDGDTIVSIVDANRIADYLEETGTLDNPAVADVNLDGIVDCRRLHSDYAISGWLDHLPPRRRRHRRLRLLRDLHDGWNLEMAGDR